jgi:hypothetical protein
MIRCFYHKAETVSFFFLLCQSIVLVLFPLTPSDGWKIFLDYVVLSLGLTFRKSYGPLKVPKTLTKLHTTLYPRNLDSSTTSTAGLNL